MLKNEENAIKTAQESTTKMPSSVDELFSQIADMFDHDHGGEMHMETEQGGEMQMEAQQGGEKSLDTQQGDQMSLDTPTLVNSILTLDEDDSETSHQLLSAASPFCFPTSTSPASSSSDQHLLSPSYFTSKKTTSSFSSSPSPSDSDYESLGSPDSSEIGLDSAFDIHLEQDSLDQLFPSLLCPENYSI